MKVIPLVFSFFAVTYTFANPQHLQGGNEVGNGGDVVVCRESILLLDFYESKVKENKEVMSSLMSEDEILKDILEKITKVDPKRGKLFKMKVERFLKETHFLMDAKLTDIPDSMHLVLPKDESCNLEQIAILDKGQVDPSKKFVINKNLWDKLNPLNKAGLIMHEIIYEYFSSLGEKNSIKTRTYNAFIFRAYTLDEYWKFSKNLRIPLYR